MTAPLGSCAASLRDLKPKESFASLVQAFRVVCAVLSPVAWGDAWQHNFGKAH